MVQLTTILGLSTLDGVVVGSCAQRQLIYQVLITLSVPLNLFIKGLEEKFEAFKKFSSKTSDEILGKEWFVRDLHLTAHSTHRWRINIYGQIGNFRSRGPEFLKTITILTLSKCALTYCEVSGLIGLVCLDLSHNQLNSIVGIKDCLALRSLDFSSNPHFDVKQLLTYLSSSNEKPAPLSMLEEISTAMSTVAQLANGEVLKSVRVLPSNNEGSQREIILKMLLPDHPHLFKVNKVVKPIYGISCDRVVCSDDR